MFWLDIDLPSLPHFLTITGSYSLSRFQSALKGREKVTIYVTRQDGNEKRKQKWDPCREEGRGSRAGKARLEMGGGVGHERGSLNGQHASATPP